MDKQAQQFINNVLIVGGGTAGWMTAAALAHKLSPAGVEVTLVESDTIGTVGVGEATLPNLRYFNQMLGIAEREMMSKTAATFKLGIEFCDWGKKGDRYIHPFGCHGEAIGGVDFHHYWTQQRLDGRVHDFGDFCFPIVAARNNRFCLPLETADSPLFEYSYAFQFDASLYAAYLSNFARSRGVKRVEGKVIDVQSDSERGDIKSVTLESGQVLSADFFIDCSGFRGLLIEQALKTGYNDWSGYLPNDSAIAVPCEIQDPVGPYTRATARSAGWQWRIPLQHRIGNGYVYWSNYISDQDAMDDLLQSLEGKPLGNPKQLKFHTGRRKRLWNKNCVAIGLSGGFLEPLESTSIDLIQTGITNLLSHFPSKVISDLDRDEYNRLMDLEFERIRDFLVLHYIANQKDDAPMWQYFRQIERPDSLNEKLEAFQRRGLVPNYGSGLFLAPSWLSVLIGQNIYPNEYDPRIDSITNKANLTHIESIRNRILQRVEGAEGHVDFIESYGAKFHKTDEVVT